MATWQEMLKEEFERRGDDFSQIICTLTEEERLVEFNDSFGSEEGKPFTAWGEHYVYFPVCYDGSEWVGSAPRNPCDIVTKHHGGG